MVKYSYFNFRAFVRFSQKYAQGGSKTYGNMYWADSACDVAVLFLIRCTGMTVGKIPTS